MAQERVQFARNQKYPQRYIDILTQNDAHSDDEYNATHKCYIVKKLPFRSANANDFFERLDQEMEKNDQFEKRRSQRRVRRRPRKAVISTICRPPKLMPIDFFDAEWFNELSTAQKFKVADSYRVALLPKAKQSFCSVSAKDEQISDKAFCSKYWDQLAGFYDLTHVMGSDHSQIEDEDDSQGSVNINFISTQSLLLLIRPHYQDVPIFPSVCIFCNIPINLSPGNSDTLSKGPYHCI